MDDKYGEEHPIFRLLIYVWKLDILKLCSFYLTNKFNAWPLELIEIRTICL